MRDYFKPIRKGTAEWHNIEDKPEPYTEVILAEYYDDLTYIHQSAYMYLDKGCELEIETGIDRNRLAPMTKEERMLERIFHPKAIFKAREDGFYWDEIDPESPYCAEPEKILKRRIDTKNYNYKWCYAPSLDGIEEETEI